MSQPNSPLSDADYRKINETLTEIASVEQEIQRAKQAGLECDEHDRLCQFAKQRLLQIKGVYFGHRP